MSDTLLIKYLRFGLIYDLLQFIKPKWLLEQMPNNLGSTSVKQDERN